MEVRAVGWRPEDLNTSSLDCLLHLALKDFRLLTLQKNDGDDLEFFG